MRSPRTASEGHATGMWYGVVLLSQAAELSWLPFARLGGSISTKLRHSRVWMEHELIGPILVFECVCFCDMS